MNAPTPYDGTVLEPAPEAGGWSPVAWEDDGARARAMQIAQAVDHADSGGELGTLGSPPAEDDLPLWHYRDELLAGGLYRFFHFEHAAGRSIGAMRFVGEASTLGAGQLPPTDQAVVDAAQAAADAINADPNASSNVCVNGTAVNSAVHAFKVAWNAAYPSSALKYDGQYDSATAAAITSEGVSAPAAFTTTCGGGGKPPPPPPPPPQQASSAGGWILGTLAVLLAGGAVATGVANAKKHRASPHF